MTRQTDIDYGGIVMLNEVKHLAHEGEIRMASESGTQFVSQILRFAQDDRNQ